MSIQKFFRRWAYVGGMYLWEFWDIWELATNLATWVLETMSAFFIQVRDRYSPYLYVLHRSSCTQNQ